MKLKPLLKMGLGNIRLYRKWQRFLFWALLLCFALISLMTSVSEGMSHNVFQASRIHYGGELFLSVLQAHPEDKPAWVEQPEILESVAQNIPGQWVKRTNLFKRAYLYFDGRPQLIKNVIGLDMEQEISHLQHYRFLEGTLDDLMQQNSIAMSASLAQIMGIRQGDSITLKTTNPRGQIGTGDFIVAVLLDDNSLLGYYRIYMDRIELNRLLGWDDNDCSSLGLFLQNPGQMEQIQQQLQSALEEKGDTALYIKNRDDFNREVGKNWNRVRNFVYPLSIYIEQVDSLLQALDLVSYFIYLMMLAISLVSVLVTYRIILHNRRKEIAMLQAMGMTSGQLELMLMTEAVMLFAFSIVAGFVLSLLLQGLFGLLQFDWIPGFGIFLKQGHLTGKIRFSRIMVNIVVLLLGVLPAVWYLVRKELKQDLSDRLAGR